MIKYKIRDIILGLGIWAVFLGIPYIISQHVQNYEIFYNNWIVYAILLILSIFYLLYPENIRTIIYKISEHFIKEKTGVNIREELSSDSEQWQDKVVVQVSPELNPPKKSPDKRFFEKLEECKENGKEDSFLKKINRKIKLEQNEEKQHKLRILLEFSYAFFGILGNDRNTTNRIENLESLIKSKVDTEEDLYNTFLYMRVICYYSSKLYEKAKDFLPFTINQLKAQKDANIKHIEILYDISASICYKEKKWSQSILYYKRALQYTDKMAFYLFKIAYIYFMKLYNSKLSLQYAKESFAQMRDSQEDFYEPLVFIYYRSAAFEKEYLEAYEVIDNFNKCENKDEFISDKSYIALKLNNKKEAEELYKKALSKNPKDDTAINVKGCIALKNKEYEEAIRCFDSIIPEFSKDIDHKFSRYYLSEIYYMRGIGHFELKHFIQAQEDFNQAETLGYDEIDIDYFDQLKVSLKHQQIAENKNEK